MSLGRDHCLGWPWTFVGLKPPDTFKEGPLFEMAFQLFLVGNHWNFWMRYHCLRQCL